MTGTQSVSLLLTSLLAFSVAAAEELKPLVRGLATRAPAEMKIDGDLSEFQGAFCTPVNYFQLQKAELLKDRPAQFFYMWDDTAFYCGLRTLDTRQFNGSDDAHLWGGDAVEWYFDTRRGEEFRAIDWGKGAVHMYWTGYDKAEIKPRWCLRPGYLDAIPGKGIELAARKTGNGAEVEFKLPWENFPNFKPAVNETIALDAELCYSDGATRIDRIFTYGSPLCVQQPAAQGTIQLVEKVEPARWKQCGAVMTPIRVDTAWGQKTKALVTGQIALPPDHADQVGKVVFVISDLAGKQLGDFAAERKTIQENGKFYLAEARWPTDLAAPGEHTVIAVVSDKSGKELSRIAPRLVSAGWTQGY
ncbi:MAG TPA: sugar-binding protein [Pirellulaceae bacterium]|jgi:hypothetical protein